MYPGREKEEEGGVSAVTTSNLCEAQGRLSELPDMLVRMTKEMMDVIKRKRKEDPPPEPPAIKKPGFAANAAAALVGLA
tara:strand:+ start:3259 stop:3495 length:237 start_codon:yes stop_codon:yes gene_type:complete